MISLLLLVFCAAGGCCILYVVIFILWVAVKLEFRRIFLEIYCFIAHLSYSLSKKYIALLLNCPTACLFLGSSIII